MASLSFGITSPFNHVDLESDSTNNYSFIVTGHFYGNQSNQTGYPCNTLLAHIDWMNQSEAKAVFCLGDLFGNVATDIEKYEQSFFTKLDKPLFNAVGNHDLKNDIYQTHFGETFYYFEINNDLHIVLDTELDNGNIEGKQTQMLKEALKEVNSKQINNVFIYAHRTLWAKHFDELNGLFKDNTQSVLGNNFKSEVLPILNEIKKQSKVYWFSGSIGGDAPASFFYFPKDDVTFIGTAIRGLPRDAVLMVEVLNGVVNFKTVSLTNQTLKKLQDYNVDFWQNNNGEQPFNYRLIPLYVKQVLLSKYFWYGFFFCLFIFMSIKLLKFKKNN
jgi:hypothetical protein